MILAALAILGVIMTGGFVPLVTLATIYAAVTGGVPHPHLGWLLRWAWAPRPRHKAPHGRRS